MGGPPRYDYPKALLRRIEIVIIAEIQTQYATTVYCYILH